MAKTYDVCGGSATTEPPCAPDSGLKRSGLKRSDVRRAGRGRSNSLLQTAAAKVLVALTVGVALTVAGCHRAKPQEAAPTGALLKVEMGKSAKLDPESALRCFVHGQFVGMQTPAQCAEKNGVPAGALDVGLDQSGSLAAGAGDAHLAPIANTVDNAPTFDTRTGDSPSPPSLPTITPAQLGAPSSAFPADGSTGDCLRYIRGAWQTAGAGVPLGVCVRTLFAGRCVAPGQALYGRWGRETVRLMPGRVEMSDNNRDFHSLVAQSASDCSLPPL